MERSLDRDSQELQAREELVLIEDGENDLSEAEAIHRAAMRDCMGY